MRHLILFDVDGTLLRCGPQIQPIFMDAMREVFGGCGELRGYSFAGKTDPRIALDLARAGGLGEDEVRAKLPAMRRVYLRNLERELRREAMRLLPGVVELLENLSTRPEILLGLLTGNWRGGAAIKLGRFDLNRFFAFGAFGDDAVDRRDLVPVALARATARCGRTFAPDETLIVGDTLLDVDCAQAAGVKSLAVATGRTAVEQLTAAGADWAFADLLQAGDGFDGFLGVTTRRGDAAATSGWR